MKSTVRKVDNPFLILFFSEIRYSYAWHRCCLGIAARLDCKMIQRYQRHTMSPRRLQDDLARGSWHKFTFQKKMRKHRTSQGQGGSIPVIFSFVFPVKVSRARESDFACLKNFRQRILISRDIVVISVIDEFESL